MASVSIQDNDGYSVTVDDPNSSLRQAADKAVKLLDSRKV